MDTSKQPQTPQRRRYAVEAQSPLCAKRGRSPSLGSKHCVRGLLAGKLVLVVMLLKNHLVAMGRGGLSGGSLDRIHLR